MTGELVEVADIASANPALFVSEGVLKVGCKSTAKFAPRLDFFSNL